MSQHYSFIVESDKTDMRIDKLLTLEYTDISRSTFQKMIKSGNIMVNNIIVKANCRVRTGDVVNFSIPDAIEPDILPENIPLNIVYEDSDIIIINKPKGMVVHPAPGHYSGTLVNALMYHCKGDLSGINGILRPGIVHRIDMNTTGILVVCKNDFAHNNLALQLKNHTINRKYEAIVYNKFSETEGTVDLPIGRNHIDRKKMAIDKIKGKKAVTHYRVINNFDRFAHVECRLETGRTHQIRVHMASINHPLLGDNVYGPQKCPFNLAGQTLHAKTLGFIHPRTGKYMEFDSDLPEYFKKLLVILDR